MAVSECELERLETFGNSGPAELSLEAVSAMAEQAESRAPDRKTRSYNCTTLPIFEMDLGKCAEMGQLTEERHFDEKGLHSSEQLAVENPKALLDSSTPVAFERALRWMRSPAETIAALRKTLCQTTEFLAPKVGDGCESQTSGEIGDDDERMRNRFCQQLERRFKNENLKEICEALKSYKESENYQRNPVESLAVLRQVERLAFNNEAALFSQRNLSDRRLIAKQCLELGTNPFLVSQGRFNTCELATMEKVLWLREPSTIAKLVADATLQGFLPDYDGKKMKLSGEAFKKNLESPTHRPEPGDRLFASQIFQTSLIEREWKGREIKGIKELQYKLLEPDADADDDSGERFVAKDGSVLFDKDDDIPVDDPGIDFTRMAKMYNSIARQPLDKDSPLVLGSTQNESYLKGGKYDSMKFVDISKNDAQLHTTLKQAQESSKFPIIAIIGVGKGEDRDLHVVTISGYDAARKRVVYHDQSDGEDSPGKITLADLRKKMDIGKAKPWQLPQKDVNVELRLEKK